MESMNYTTPGIAAILETLRAYNPQSHTHYAPTEETYVSEIPMQAEAKGEEELEEGEHDPYDPLQPMTTIPHPQPNPQQLPFVPRSELQNSSFQLREQQKPLPVQQPPVPQHIPQPVPKKTYQTPTYPPTTIITWAPALRHVTSLHTNNLEFTHRIRHLIKTQHDHERQWHSGRLALIQKLSTRGDSRSKLDSVLGSLGGIVKKRALEDEVSVEDDLRTYDKKVYKACQEMGAACVKELQKLEVPFFCTMRGLVTTKGEGEKKVEKKKGTIREEELMDLRGRMVQLLEDLCGSEDE